MAQDQGFSILFPSANVVVGTLLSAALVAFFDILALKTNPVTKVQSLRD